MKFRIALFACFVLMPSMISRAAVRLRPATAPSITPDARHLLDQIRDAYASLKSITISGQSQGQFDIDGFKHDANATFTGSWWDGKFKNETVGDALIGNTGDRLYLYIPAHNSYLLREAPDDKVNLDTIGSDLADILRDQDLSLALALSADAQAELTSGAVTVSTVDSRPLGGRAAPTLRIVKDSSTITLTIDPQTHLIAREEVDYTQMAKQRGAHTVERALYAVDFINSTSLPPDPASFRWSPPPGSHEAQQYGPSMVGKRAPPFKLATLDGKTVSLADFKGSILVIDLWATWCGPCVESLPHLDQLSKDFTPAGVKFLAVSVDEAAGRDAVVKFAAQNRLSIPVALDPDGKLLEAYGAQGIPYTIVIGKDGKVRKIFLGSGHEKEIREEIESAVGPS